MSDPINVATNYFDVTPDYNPSLAINATTFSASFIVTPHGFPKVTGGSATKRFKAIVIDRSPSMEGSKFAGAKSAGVAFVQLVDEHDFLCVIMFDGGADTAFAPALATAENKQKAIAAINNAGIGNSTSLSAGVNQAYNEYKAVLKNNSGLVGDVVLLTDGEDQDGESTRTANMTRLRSNITSQEQSFKVHPRGIGTELHIAELRSISDATNGMAPKLVVDPRDLAADFSAALKATQAVTLEKVNLCFAIPPKAGVKIVSFKQIAPTISDLTKDEKLDADGQTHIFPTGAWDDQPREFFITLAFDKAKEDGKKAAPARVQLRYAYAGKDGIAPAEPIVLSVEWTSDSARSSKIPAGVLRATGNVELMQAVQEGTTLLMDGKNQEATVKLGRAVQLATQTNNPELLATLKEMVHVDNADQGTVRIKQMTQEERTVKAMRADTASTVRKAAPTVRQAPPPTASV